MSLEEVDGDESGRERELGCEHRVPISPMWLCGGLEESFRGTSVPGVTGPRSPSPSVHLAPETQSKNPAPGAGTAESALGRELQHAGQLRAAKGLAETCQSDGCLPVAVCLVPTQQSRQSKTKAFGQPLPH